MNQLAVVRIICVLFVAVARTETDKIPQLASNLGLTTLVEKVVEADLADALSGPGPFTVFGPNNDAFDNLRSPKDSLIVSDKPVLIDLLLFHVLSDEVLSSDLKDELTVDTLNGQKARVNLYPKGEASFQVATLQCAPLDPSQVNQRASNGVIHVLNSVIMPPTQNILGFLSFKVLMTVSNFVKAAGLDVAMAGEIPLTLFAPSNSAFAKLSDDVVNNLMATPGALKNVLLGHVLNGTYCSAGLTSGSLKTLSGQDVQIIVTSDGFTVNGANVLQEDGSVTNGVVHTIDTVLVP